MVVDRNWRLRNSQEMDAHGLAKMTVTANVFRDKRSGKPKEK
jgi:hypothetical protein